MAGPRRALAQRGGELRRRGDPALQTVMTEAWQAAHGSEDALTHGFHTYPARMHFAIARRLIAGFGRPGDTLLDPFCGSGTTLVEGMVAGLRGTGIDLNPIALRVAAIKTERRNEAERARFDERLSAVVEASLSRVRDRVPVMAPLRAHERRFYDPHVLKELGGLHAEIEAVKPASDRKALLTLLSSIVVKFSRQRADTDGQTVAKRIGKGVPTRFFGRKGQELLTRWAQLDAACPPTAERPRLLEADARAMDTKVSAKARARLVLTSPPYGGTYDYAEHHVRRYAWLGVSPRGLREGEIGARRFGQGSAARQRWDDDVQAVLEAMRRAMHRDGLAIWVMGDGQIGRQRIPADRQLETLAPNAGLEVAAVVSQQRTDWQGQRPRWEHLIAMRARR